jgi:hypothetical protein
MYIKIMSQESLPDSDVFKHHQIVETKEYIFFFDDDNKMDAVRYFDQFSKSYKTVWLEHANVYIMNDDGKTINSFQPRPRKSEKDDYWENIEKGIEKIRKIDYMSIFQQQYNILNDRVYDKIVSLDDFLGLKENLIIKITGPRQSGKTEFCLQLNKEYNCINIYRNGKIYIPTYKNIPVEKLDKTYLEGDEYNKTDFVVIDNASTYTQKEIDKIIKWSFEVFDTQPFIVLVG